MNVLLLPYNYKVCWFLYLKKKMVSQFKEFHIFQCRYINLLNFEKNVCLSGASEQTSKTSGPMLMIF